MKPTLFALLLLMALALAAVSQDYPEFTLAMKYMDTANNALMKLEKKTGPEVVGSAEKLAAVYENMIAFWRQRNAAKAVRWSEEGKAAALQLASAANSDDAAKAEAAFKTVGATCQSCHDACREKTPDGKYRIKSAP